jgi:hypothetical protein
MALISSFTHMRRSRYRIHAPVACRYHVFKKKGQVYLQLDTGGSESRNYPGKTSQSVQFNAHSARALCQLIDAVYSEQTGSDDDDV